MRFKKMVSIYNRCKEMRLNDFDKNLIYKIDSLVYLIVLKTYGKHYIRRGKVSKYRFCNLYPKELFNEFIDNLLISIDLIL